MTQDELKLVLEALITITDAIYVNSQQEADAVYKANDAITAIKEALAQPEQEPVHQVGTIGHIGNGKATLSASIFSALQAAPHPPRRTWVGLTEDDKVLINHDANFNQFMTAGEYANRVQALTEARLKDKNT